MSVGGDEPAWKQRAVERSLRSAKERAGQRVQKFLDAAQAIIVEKGSTDFTVQEVVDRSKQSLRSFYLQFDGKHGLLLALYEDAMMRMARQIRTATENETEPIERFRIAVELLYEVSQPDPEAQRPLFTEFGPQLIISHPAEMRLAHVSLYELFVELLEGLAETGQLREGAAPRRLAAMVMQTILFVSQPASADLPSQRITADEVWQFCAFGVSR